MLSEQCHAVLLLLCDRFPAYFDALSQPRRLPRRALPEPRTLALSTVDDAPLLLPLLDPSEPALNEDDEEVPGLGDILARLAAAPQPDPDWLARSVRRLLRGCIAAHAHVPAFTRQHPLVGAQAASLLIEFDLLFEEQLVRSSPEFAPRYDRLIIRNISPTSMD